MPRCLPSALVLLLLSGAVADGQPRIPPPTLKSVMAGNLVGKARVRWSKVVGGERVSVSVGAGLAERLNPQWAPEPVRLRYDLNQNLLLEREIKRARLGPTRAPSSEPDDRSLEILARGAEGWVVVGSWAMPRARWQRQAPALYRMLEALLDAPTETFVPVKGLGRQ